MLIYVHANKSQRGSRRAAPHTFLTSALGEVELSTPRLRPLYARENSPHYPLHRSLGSPLTRSGCLGVEIHLLPLMGFELHIVALSLSSLRYRGS